MSTATPEQRDALVFNMMLHGKMSKHTARQIVALVFDGVHPADVGCGRCDGVVPGRKTGNNCAIKSPASLRRRSPLTQDAILDMAEGCTLEFHSMLAFARAVERAHGIEA